MTETFTRAARKITADWGQLLTHLVAWKPQFLVQLVGPILSGVLLDRRSPNDAYHPSVFAHDMSVEAFDGPLTLDLDYPLRTPRTNAIASVPVRSHAERFREACVRLIEQSPLALDRPPRRVELEHCLSEILASEQAVGRASGRVARNALDLGNRLARWARGGSDQAQLRERVERRVQYLKLTKIHWYELG